MKRTVCYLVLLMLMAPMAAMAAEVEIGGEFEATGIWRENMAAFDADVDDTQRGWYGNLVLSLDATAAENVKLHATYTITDGTWGDPANGDPAGLYNTSGTASDDVAYAEVVIDSYTFNIGRQLNEWGHMLLTDGDGVDRAQAYRAFAEGMRLGINVDKLQEFGNPDGADDSDRYGVFFEREDGEDLKYGLYFARTSIGNFDGFGNSMDGSELDFYISAKLGSVNLDAELAAQSGDVFEDSAGNSPLGLFVTAAMEMEPMTLTGTVAYAANGYVASPYFNPTFLVGTDQDTSYADFSAPDDDTATLFAIGLDYAINDKWTAGAKFAIWTIASNGEMAANELDLMAEYAIAEGATWGVYGAYMMPTDGDFDAAAPGVQDDPAYALLQSLAIEF